MNSETRQCQNCKNQFTIEPEDFVFYERIQVPAPEDCPQCRQTQRLIFRNFKTLYKRNSDASDKSMVSMYPPRAPYKVYERDEWWSDSWDPLAYGRDFDFSRPFFEQVDELWRAVPRIALTNIKSENCPYSNFTYGSKNCYLIFGCVEDEECAYGHIVWESKDSLDNLYLFKSELCYECVDVLNSYRLLYSQESEDCAQSIGLFDCRGCANCIGCVGLQQKSYYVFNESVGKSGYEKFLSEHPLTDPQTVALILGRQKELRKKLPQRYFFGSHNNNVSGNHIYNSKNVHYAFDVKRGEDSKYVFTAKDVQDVYDGSFLGTGVELLYHSLTCGGKSIFFSHFCVDSHDVYYSDNCYGSPYLFGCSGLRNKSYCVLNKQYSKENYQELVDRITAHMRKTGEWGKFFPVSMSPFAYNESIVNEYTPLTKEEALSRGFRWTDDIPSTTGQETVAHKDLPQNPADFSDALLKEVLRCESCGHNYRLISQEIGFYKRLGLPIPRECFNCRHQRRMDMRNRRTLWPGECAKCSVGFVTSYPPAEQEKYKIYCEECYKKEMV